MAGTTKTSANDDPRIVQQYKKIKDRLIKHYTPCSEKNGLTFSTVRDQLSEMPEGFDVSYTALRDVLTYNDKIPNMCIVLGLCRLWQMDYATVLAPPESNVKPVPSSDALMAKSAILDDPDYSGTFYGYMYTKNLSRNEVSDFELDIKPLGNTTVAKFRIHSRPSKVDGKVVDYEQFYTGTPIRLTKTNSIFMLLSNDKGYFYFLLFGYRAYNFDKLYFRKGIAITTESESDKLLLQNFLLFQKEIDEEKREKFFPGMLKITDDCIWIPKADIDALRGDVDFSEILEKYDSSFSGKERQMYRIKVTQILDCIEDKFDQDEINEAMQVLFALQGKAVAPSRIEYANPDGLPGFAKIYLQSDSV